MMPHWQGLREKFFQGVRGSMPGPQNYVKYKQINQKKVFTQNCPLFSAQNQGHKKGKGEKNFGQNLMRQPQLFRAPLDPGTMYPLNPPPVGPAHWGEIDFNK